MKITIVYATYSNSTALACEHLSQSFQTAGHTVSLQLAAQVTANTLQEPELLVLASPSWDYDGQQGMPHEDFELMQKQIGEVSLEGKPTAVMALGDSSFTYFCGAADHLSTWLTQMGGTEIVPPLKIDQYYANEPLAQQQILDWSTQILEKIVAK